MLPALTMQARSSDLDRCMYRLQMQAIRGYELKIVSTYDVDEWLGPGMKYEISCCLASMESVAPLARGLVLQQLHDIRMIAHMRDAVVGSKVQVSETVDGWYIHGVRIFMWVEDPARVPVPGDPEMPEDDEGS